MGSNSNNNDNNKLEQTICLLSTEFIQIFFTSSLFQWIVLYYPSSWNRSITIVEKDSNITNWHRVRNDLK